LCDGNKSIACSAETVIVFAILHIRVVANYIARMAIAEI